MIPGECIYDSALEHVVSQRAQFMDVIEKPGAAKVLDLMELLQMAYA